MIRYTPFALILVCVSIIGLLGMQRPAELFQTKSGTVTFISNAQLEKIEAKNDKVEAALNRSDKSISFKVSVVGFEGFNSDLQHEHFQENYMEIDQYPTATFKGKIVEDVDLSKEGQYKVRAKGILDIHGNEVERVIPGTLNVKSDQISIISNFEITLADHNIKTPRIVNQKIAQNVEVEVNVNLLP